jgi:hypothetical protein
MQWGQCCGKVRRLVEILVDTDQSGPKRPLLSWPSRMSEPRSTFGKLRTPGDAVIACGFTLGQQLNSHRSIRDRTQPRIVLITVSGLIGPERVRSTNAATLSTYGG